MQIVDDELARDLSLLLLLLSVVIVRRRLLLVIYYIRFTFVYYTFFSMCWSMHGSAKTNKRNDRRFRQRRAPLRKQVRIDRVRHHAWLCNIMYISILLCMVHRILALVAPKYVYTKYAQLLYFYSNDGAMGPRRGGGFAFWLYLLIIVYE